MDDSCAVCAETLVWVAYGPCGHREVCSTCVARLRCICEDRHCCICKSESSTIFVTKALGDFTRMINDFSVFPADPMEGRVGSYWYHEDTQAYFDDLDQYKMIKAMCRLSCSICDNYSEQGRDWPKRKGRFRSIEQLKGHLFHKHRLFMCSLCLEGRKIFICEQKLYTRVQLNGHVKEGDLEVDGSENERGGFIGHPQCEFCRNPFYGENELYQHMSTEHYTCHICQRQNPGQYEYYKNYDDLEIHFRQEHFLCEDESCLAKKFVVFPTESEIKRHNAKEHGGHMSRSKRNAALQIPTSFHYRRNVGQDRHGRGRNFHHDSSDGLSLAIQASLETANANTALDPPAAGAQSVSDRREMNEVDSILSSFESLARTDSEPSSKYREAVGRSSPLEVASFPPLPAASSKSKHKSNNSSDELGGNTIAARLRCKNIGTVKVLNTSPAWPPVSHQPASSAVGSRPRLVLNSAPSLPSISHPRLVSSNSVPSLPLSYASSSDKLIGDSSRVWPPVSHQPTSSAAGSHPRLVSSSAPSLPLSSHSRLVLNSAPSLPSSSAGSSSDNSVTDGSMHAGYVNSVLARAASASSASSSGKSSSTNNNIHGEPIYSTTDFPPVSATQMNKQPKNAQPPLKMEDVHTANKSLVEKIRAALDYDEEKFGAFKVVSADYRQDLIDMGEYLAYVHQFGLSHLILELARLCPDPQKQKRLVEIHESNLSSNGNCTDNDGARSRSRSSSVKKSKTKYDGGGVSDSKGNLSDDILKASRSLQSNYEPSEVEVLSKDGYRSGKGKSKFPTPEDSRGENGSVSGGNGSKKSGNAEAVHKQKKTSKFLRLRLGEAPSAELINHDNVGHSSTEKDDSSDGPPVRGAWKNGGGQRLVGKNYRE